MSNLPIEVVDMLGQTLAKVLPVTLGLALLFSVLSHFWACNPGRPWWRKRELVTDLSYWFLVPLFARVFRIGLAVLGAALIFRINDADALTAFYDNGHGPLAALPLWLQAVLALVLADFMMYWLHRRFHRGGFWKYHAIHHSSEDVDWISAARFHPVNLLLGTIGIDGRHFTRRVGLARPVQYSPFGLRPCQPELDARAVPICAGDAGVPSLASHLAPGGRRYQFCRYFSALGHPVRHLPDAGGPVAGRLRHRGSGVVSARACRATGLSVPEITAVQQTAGISDLSGPLCTS
jgi:hypothetical protein